MAVPVRSSEQEQPAKRRQNRAAFADGHRAGIESPRPGVQISPGGRSPDGALRRAGVLGLQRIIGNTAVASKLQRKDAKAPEADVTEDQPDGSQADRPMPPAPPVTRTYTNVVSYNLSAKIRQADNAAGASMAPGSARPPLRRQARGAGADSDSAEAGAGAEVVKEEEEGRLTIMEGDSVGSTLAYAPVIGASATAPGPSEFGVTSTSPSVSGIAVVHDVAATAFKVTATVNNSVTWSVHSLGRTDVPSAAAPAVTAANYATAASDLTPDMASDGGRPPRTLFWAQDLTAKHEQFHANERANTYGKPAFDFAENWLKGQAAADEAEVRTLVNQVPAKMRENYATAYSPGKETRAYGDGAPSYKARADAITAKYAAPPPPP